MKMNEKLKKQNILRLDINDNIINKLKDNNILKLGELCCKNESQLRELNLNNDEIDKIKQELEQIGLLLRN